MPQRKPVSPVASLLLPQVAVFWLSAAAYVTGTIWHDLTGEQLLDFPLRITLKVLPIIVLLPLARTSRLVQLALVLSACGDAALCADGAVMPDVPWFLLGLVAFAMAHLVYVVVFLRDTRAPAILPAIPFAVYAVIYAGYLIPGTPDPLVVPVCVYATLIGLMAWRSAASVIQGARAGAAFAGAFLFLVSDSLLGYDRFRAALPFARTAVMTTYYLAQYGIAVSSAPASDAGTKRKAD